MAIGMTGSERKLLLQMAWALDRLSPASGLLKALEEFVKEDSRRAEAKIPPAPEEADETRRQAEAFRKIQRVGEEVV